MSGTRYNVFASDNAAGICPEAWDALAAANADDPTPGYGNDSQTTRARELFRQTFETDCDVHFVFNGTAANSLALASLNQRHHAILCHRQSHIETDECGAPEFFTGGSKLVTADSEDGKLTPTMVSQLATARDDVHFSMAHTLSLTQSTELGTLYSPAELTALCETAKKHSLQVHLDGARFANAVAATGKSPAELSWRAGVDVLCLGGTKNGMPVGEAVVFFNRDLAAAFNYRVKQSGQLASKMRFLSAPWLGILKDGPWLRHATHANMMARKFAERLTTLGLKPRLPVQANAIFVTIPDSLAAALRDRGWRFYNFIDATTVRFMCSWDTRMTDIDALLADINEFRNAGEK